MRINEHYTLNEVNKNTINNELMAKIENHAYNSIYKMNTGSANCYAFSLDKIGQKHMDGTISKGNDFSGGWDWLKALIDYDAEYILKLDDKKLYKINYINEINN